MTRPRIVAVVSAIIASASAFLVVSRWSLFGTVAGVVLFTVVNTFVSHWSSEGLDRASGLLRRRLQLVKPEEGRADTASLPAALRHSSAARTSATGDGRGEPPRVSPRRVPYRRTAVANWLLVGCALIAVSLSIYAVTSPREDKTVETVVVRQQVIEKTVTVTTEGADSVAQTRPARQSDGATPAVDSTATTAGASDLPATTSEPTTEEAAPSTSGATNPGRAGDEETLPSTGAPATDATEPSGFTAGRPVPMVEP